MVSRPDDPIQDDTLDIARFWGETSQLLRRHRWGVLLFGLLVGCLSGILTLTRVPREYLSKATFFLGPLPTQGSSLSLQRLFSGLTGSSLGTSNVLPNELAVQILMSRRFAEETIVRFNLLPLLGDGSLQDAASTFQQERLQVQLGTEGVISVAVILPGTARILSLGDLVPGGQVHDRDEQVRQLAAQIANHYIAMLDEYIRGTAVDDSTAFLASARQSFERAQVELDKARREAAAFQLEQRDTPVLPEAATRLMDKLVTLEKEKALAEVALRAQGSGGPEMTTASLSPETGIGAEAQDSVLTQLNQQLAQLKVEIDQKSERLGPEHPEWLELLDRYEALQEQIAEEEARLVTEGRGRVDALQRQIDNTREQLRAFAQTQEEYQEKELSLRIAASVYEAIAVQLKQAELEASARGLQLKVVDTAIPPESKVRPSTLRSAALGLILGWMLSLSWVWFRHLRERMASAGNAPPAV